MKFARAVLILSIAANLAFAAWWSLRVSAKIDTVTPHPSTENRGLVPPQSFTHTDSTWSSWQAGSDADYAATLRKQGFPPAVIRALVMRRVKARYQARLDALESQNPLPYWRYQAYRNDERLTPELRKQRRQLLRKIDDEVKLAVGGDVFDWQDPYEQAVRLRTYGNLSKSKADQVALIRGDYDELYQQVSDRSGKVWLQEDQAQLEFLRKAQREDLAATLTPEELIDYDIRGLSSNYTFAMKLNHFEASEVEFRALAKLQLEFEKNYPRGITREIAKQREAEEKKLVAQMAAALGGERGQEFVLVNDPSYIKTSALLENYSYGKDLVREFVSLQRGIIQRAEAIQQQSLYSPAQREAEFAALQREASAKISAKLTPEAMAAYQKSGAGSWLNQLQTPAPQAVESKP